MISEYFLLCSFIFSITNAGYTAVVHNNCPWTLYMERTAIDSAPLHSNMTAENAQNVKTNHVTPVSSKGTINLDITQWASIAAGQRLYAWWANPIGKNLNPMTYRDKVEINICGPNHFCYNPTAVDYFALPVWMQCAGAQDTGCKIATNTIRSQCATAFTTAGVYGVCQSQTEYCFDNPNAAVCHQLDTLIQQCASQNPSTCGKADQTNPKSQTLQVYGCFGYFDGQPCGGGNGCPHTDGNKWCAALNRGIYSQVNAGNPQTDPSIFYKKPPYNPYSAWLHRECGNSYYGFPYDDYGGQQSGYRECTNSDTITITFCPSS